MIPKKLLDNPKQDDRQSQKVCLTISKWWLTIVQPICTHLWSLLSGMFFGNLRTENLPDIDIDIEHSFQRFQNNRVFPELHSSISYCIAYFLRQIFFFFFSFPLITMLIVLCLYSLVFLVSDWKLNFLYCIVSHFYSFTVSDIVPVAISGLFPVKIFFSYYPLPGLFLGYFSLIFE